MALNDVETKVVYVFPRGRRHVWVADGLRRDIMLGDIEPGATLVELEVGARFQCSQSTAREALMLLQKKVSCSAPAIAEPVSARGRRTRRSKSLRLRRDIECRAAQRLFSRNPPGAPLISCPTCARTSPVWRPLRLQTTNMPWPRWIESSTTDCSGPRCPVLS